ncbi:MAG: hypothetical protein KME21_23400 [Desmonostoc vinosum HA7617-LM4]|nr:hypothetical protein [Desmonostoc vinosum HA7617-LM4]
MGSREGDAGTRGRGDAKKISPSSPSSPSSLSSLSSLSSKETGVINVEIRF